MDDIIKNIPLVEFNEFKSTTETLTISFKELESINLDAIFLLMPVLSNNEIKNYNLETKYGKIIYPIELNKKGLILSMKYREHVRGIKINSTEAWPHVIIMVIGTGNGNEPLTLKFGHNIQITGYINQDLICSSLDKIINNIYDINNNLIFLKEKREKFQNFITDQYNLKDIDYFKIKTICDNFTIDMDDTTKKNFLENFLCKFENNLFRGNFKYDEYKNQMINIQFDLGTNIDYYKLTKALEKTPFECYYNNAKIKTAIMVYLKYEKFDDNKKKEGRISLKISKCGHVLISGPCFQELEKCYYTFYKFFLLNYESFISYEIIKKNIKKNKNPICYSKQEWLDFVKKQRIIKYKVLNNQMPMYDFFL